jgi:hypothetical protein
MKKTMKTKLAIGTFAVALGVASIFPQPSHATSADVQDPLWGAPVKVEKLANGSEIRYYTVNVIDGTKAYRIVEVQKDGKFIFKGFSSKAETY